MTEHIRPAHPGCQQCTTFHVQLAREAGDLGHAKKTLVRAQAPTWPYPDQVAGLVDQVNVLKARRAVTIETYHQHYTSSHPNFADAGNPFARSPSHRLTEDDVTELKAMLREGVPRTEIAEAFGVSTSTVQYHAARAGLDRNSTADQRIEQRADELSTAATDDKAWEVDALCAQTDPESFFPEKGGSTRQAKAVCASCTVAAECLDYALVHEERFGIWGGLSERERRKLLKAMSPENAPTPTPPTEGTAA